jgi:hypothetical protein
MALLDQTAAILQRVGYSLNFFSHKRPSFSFEDNQVIGFATEFSSPAELHDLWQTEQDEFLRKNTFTLRKAGHKSWNIYFVLLCVSDSDDPGVARDIEEDFRGARKIVVMNPTGESGLLRALLPLLPIQNSVQARDENVRDLLFERLDLPAEIKDALRSGVSTAELIKMVAEGQ